ncbi:MAG: hypothetical protein NC319_09880, partial [Butyricicoccus sp.]|nr:hypothetical protein [Butyricicoccus sp.]
MLNSSNFLCDAPMVRTGALNMKKYGRPFSAAAPFVPKTNPPCRLLHTKTYRTGRWVPCRSFTL